MTSRLKTSLLVAITALIGLELLLHAASCVSWSVYSKTVEHERTTNDRIVLCVGDSFTYGIGKAAEDGDYPAQLEKVLRANLGADWRVVNGAWPGRSSRGILEDIDGQLREWQPEVVCLLVGANDRWRQDKELVLSRGEANDTANDGSFRWEWRTLQVGKWFVRTVVGGVMPAGPERGAPPESGSATERDIEAELAALPPTEADAIAFLEDLHTEHRGPESLRAAAVLAEKYPKSGVIRSHLTWQRFVTGDVSGGLEALDQSLQLLPEDDGTWRPKLLWLQASLLKDSDPEKATASATEAKRLSGGRMSHGEFMAMMEELTPAKTMTTYESHMRQIVGRCRAKGADVVLMTYPGRNAPVHRSMRRLADELDLDLVDQVAAFEERIEPSALADHFIPDGHCNDAGYAVMAAVVAETVEKIVRSR